MYALAVSDHIMIAHSFRGEVFGPAQKLHGATYGVEVEFRRAELDEHGLVCDIGLALQVLKEVLAGFNYHNLDDLPDLAGRNTTTEFMAGEIFRRMKSRVAQGAVGPGTAGVLESMRVVLRESPVAWASFEGSLR
ncbi:MAG: 6-carboxytetrahydropterin synthase [Betaproteobacteria bacterium]|nr:6-carboxytetrahydropterin synthase [Betaproteobacteria bacterium]